MVSRKSTLERGQQSPGRTPALSCSGRWFLIVLCAVAGLIVSICLVRVFLQREHRLIEAKFGLDANRQVDRIRRGADRIVTSVLVLRAFFAGSEEVEADEFRVFTEPLTKASPDVMSFGWAPLEVGETGSESFRVLYSTSHTPPVAIVGWDLASEPACLGAIHRAQTSGDTALSAPFTRPGVDVPIVLLAAPLRNGAMKGIAFGLFAPAAVLESAMLPQHAETMIIGVFDGQEPTSPALMAEHRGEGFESDRAWETRQPGQTPFARTFDVNGRVWLVETRPASNAFARYRGWLPWGAGAAAILLTTAGIGIFVLLAVQTARVERLVSIRTAEVKQSEERLRTITSAALDAVIMMAPDGTVAHWNPAAERIFGFRQSEIMGRNIHATLVPEPYRDQATDALRRFAETGEGNAVGKTLEVNALRKDGTQFAIEISVAAIRMGNQWGAVAVLRDITERRAAKETLLKEQKLLRQLLDFQERERKLIAYEIHDGLVQQLTGALMTFQSLPQAPGGEDTSARDRFEAASGLLRDAIAEARRLISGLRPPVLDEAGLGPAVTVLVDQQNRRGGPRIELVSDLGNQRLSPLVETAAFRIIQEGLSNACRHSRAEHVDVELHTDGKQLNIEVQDSGKGFDPDHVGTDHFGLQGIRERARLLEGTAEILSAPGEGTKIRVTLPVQTPAGGN